ncbi:hypothetical protein PVAND_013817 [Polypedilum vanderplanki]|uniref:Odorant receptor n=1 Tax=Polypedilum vanderplanki TaxID=319348 RepID=A0A9J6CRM9_POLVA|nr:hypothetical protein PVAND_013817 [Polypedilum vanderplanki]
MARIWTLKLKIQSFFRKFSNPYEVFTAFETSLKFFGLWITKKSSKFYIFLAIINRLFLIDLSIVLQFIYLPQVKTIVELSTINSILTAYIRQFCEISVFYSKIDKIQDLIKDVKSCMVDFEVNEIISKRISSISKILRGVQIFSQATISISAFSSFSYQKLFYFMWLPFQIEADWKFMLVLLYQLLNCWYLMNIDIFLQFMPIYFMNYICGFLEQICERLENLNFKQNKKKELIKCAELYFKVYRINSKVNEVFQWIFLIKFVVTSAIICSIIFSIIIVSDIAYANQVAGYAGYVLMIQIFVPCFYGNKIENISSKISTIIGHSEWMLEEKDYRQNVKLTMEFVKKPMKITSFDLFDVKLESFARVCQSAYSLYAVFKSLNENQA